MGIHFTRSAACTAICKEEAFLYMVPYCVLHHRSLILFIRTTQSGINITQEKKVVQVKKLTPPKKKRKKDYGRDLTLIIISKYKSQVI